jgi:hypothetical protein
LERDISDHHRIGCCPDWDWDWVLLPPVSFSLFIYLLFLRVVIHHIIIIIIIIASSSSHGSTLFLPFLPFLCPSGLWLLLLLLLPLLLFAAAALGGLGSLAHTATAYLPRQACLPAAWVAC